MSATATVPPEVAEYLAAVRETLRDLPAAERDDLLLEVEASLVEAASEGGAIAARLGPPQEFAAELRAAAGLHEPPAAARTTGLRSRIAGAVASLAEDPRAAAARRLLAELAPIWWLVRAYVAVAALALWADWPWATLHPAIPSVGIGGPGSGFNGVVLIALVAVASVALGLIARRRGGILRRIAVGANVVLVLAILPVLGHLADDRPTEVAVPQAVTVIPMGLVYDGQPVTNLYPYSRDGRLLLDVLLYDGAGQPVAVAGGSDDAQRRILRTPAGEPIFNAFPLRYYEPGGTEVEDPRAAPRVEIPEIVTPALERRDP